MALEFDPAVNRYQAVSGYTKAAETGKTAEASPKRARPKRKPTASSCPATPRA